ncbi:MAG: TIGR02530 family flagellar biosynthesis protein [Dehalococcoidia bacterium]
MAGDVTGVGGRLPLGRPLESAPVRSGQPDGDFQLALERSQLEFSNHALKRIEQRGLQLDGPRLERLGQAVDRAESKGSRDSLILLDELALVVSVQNRTVVTAMDESSRKEHVFTNIDSVVIAE